MSDLDWQEPGKPVASISAIAMEDGDIVAGGVRDIRIDSLCECGRTQSIRLKSDSPIEVVSEEKRAT